MSREIEGLKLENEVFRNYLERQIHDQPEGDEVPTEGKKVCPDLSLDGKASLYIGVEAPPPESATEADNGAEV